MTTRLSPSIGCIGAGNMGTSIISGLLKSGVAAQQLMLSNRRLAKLKQYLNIKTTTDNNKIIQSQKIIILAVKPQDLITLIESLSPNIPNPSPLFISIAAGVKIETLQKYLPQSTIIRAMPNTATQCQQSATGLYSPKDISHKHRAWAEQIFQAIGTVTWVSHESQLDVVTAIAGSGPAYFYLFMDYLTQSAIKQGLSLEQARALVTQTALGAAQLAQTNPNTSLDKLKQQVTSKGGTTAAALEIFESGAFQESCENAIAAAIKRAKELAG